MKIGIMGATDSVEKIFDIISEEYREIHLIKYAEDEIKKLLDMARSIDNSIDGIFLTGIGVYSELSSKIRFEKPVIYTERGIIGIIKAIHECSKDYKNMEDLKIGLDIVKEKDFLDVLNEFNIKIKGYDIQGHLPNKSEEEYLNYYLQKYNSNEIDCIFTSFGFIYNYLRKKRIPVYRIQATNIDIKTSFIKLKNKIRLESLNERVVQIQIIQVIDGNQEKNTNRYIGLEEEIMIYSKEIEGMMQKIDQDQYLIISNKGAALSQANIKSLYNLVEGYKEKNIILGVGIGEGETLYQSENNARNALRRSSTEKQGNIYFYDGLNVIGPIMREEQIHYRNVADKDIMKLSKNIGISYQYIERINGVINKLGRDEFTSKELAEILSISERTANRILRNIIDKGYGKESNLENSLGVGRPRRKIKIEF